MFGGTWTRIVDRFLLGGSSVSYEIGSTGGEAEHTLSIYEMPKHTHDFKIKKAGLASGSNYSRLTSDGDATSGLVVSSGGG
jgi:microcystin-dependent protein